MIDLRTLLGQQRLGSTATQVPQLGGSALGTPIPDQTLSAPQTLGGMSSGYQGIADRYGDSGGMLGMVAGAMGQVLPQQAAPQAPQIGAAPASAPAAPAAQPSWVQSLLPQGGAMPPSAQGQRPSWVSSLMSPQARQSGVQGLPSAVPGGRMSLGGLPAQAQTAQSRWGGMFGGDRRRLGGGRLGGGLGARFASR